MRGQRPGVRRGGAGLGAGSCTPMRRQARRVASAATRAGSFSGSQSCRSRARRSRAARRRPGRRAARHRIRAAAAAGGPATASTEGTGGRVQARGSLGAPLPQRTRRRLKLTDSAETPGCSRPSSAGRRGSPGAADSGWRRRGTAGHAVDPGAVEVAAQMHQPVRAQQRIAAADQPQVAVQPAVARSAVAVMRVSKRWSPPSSSSAATAVGSLATEAGMNACPALCAASSRPAGR